MEFRAQLAASAVAVFASGAFAAPDLGHLIDDSGVIQASGTKGLYPCKKSFFCTATSIDAKTMTWRDRSGHDHPDGCTVTWEYTGIEVFGMSKLRWKINALDGETYYFDPNIGIKLDDDDNNDRRLDLDQEGYDFGRKTFTWFDFNRRIRGGDYPGESDPTKRGIRFDFRIFRERGANGAPGPELCGSRDPVIYNRG